MCRRACLPSAPYQLLPARALQGMLGKKQVEHVLARLGLMPEGSTLPQAFPEVRCSSWSRVGQQPCCSCLTRSHFPLPVTLGMCGVWK